MILDGNKGQQTGSFSCVVIENSTDVELLNLHIRDAFGFDCVLVRNSQGVRVEVCELFGSDGHGVLFQNCKNCELVHNDVHDCSTILIDLDRSSGCEIIENETYNCPEDGIALDFESTDNLVQGNIVHNNQHYGIAVDHGDAPGDGRNRILDNEIFLNGWNGIAIISSSHNRLERNVIANNSQGGHNQFDEILLHSVSTANVIDDNEIVINAPIKARWAISEGNIVDDFNQITNNQIMSGVTGTINRRGPNTIVSGNTGA
jgi:parallel beta-helix repeat protein